MPNCKRCGTCCQDVRLDIPPEVLEKAYHFWRESSLVDPAFSEIYLIYPMLQFQYKNYQEDLPYHYKCKHFIWDEKGLAACSIYAIRPVMCRHFPYYEEVETLERDEPLSPYEGCGYNEEDM